MRNSIKELVPFSIRRKYGIARRKIAFETIITLSKLKRQFKRPNLPKNDGNEIYLHLGCGPINHPQFINIDGLPAPHIHYVRGIDDLSIFKDESVDLIYACHCLEHFSHNEINRVLEEWFRALKKGGTLRLSVPDFDLILKIYNENGNEINTIVFPLMGGHIDKYDVHLNVFNRKSLERTLLKIGFRDAHEWHPDTTALTVTGDWSDRKILINDSLYAVSLNMEAIK